MLLYSKNYALQQYQHTSIKNCFTSQFIYHFIQDIPNLRRLEISIQTPKQKSIHFFYLWLLTRQIPYSYKFHLSWKYKGSNSALLRVKARKHYLHVAIRPINHWTTLHEILEQIIALQLSAEKRIWNFKNNQLQVLIPTVPITLKTRFLQAKNSYFPTIPLKLCFTWNGISAFQKVLFLRTFRILNRELKIKGCDLF